MTNNDQVIRRGRGKTKTGCLTCKFRRVKCDETKPFCLRCTSFGRRCDGYELPHSKSKKAERRKENGILVIRPRPLLTTYTPMVTIPGNDEERRYFRLFSQETVSEMCGYFDSIFWAQIVPQASLSEPCIRYAVTAIASLSKMADAPPDKIRPTALRKVRDEHYRFGIEQYNKAIMSLRVAFAGHQGNLLRTALIASVLFVCIESIQGDQAAATGQVHSGLNLMHQVQRMRLQLHKAGKLPVIEDEIVQMYSNINVQSFFLVFSHNPHHPEIVPPHMQEARRHIFSSSIPHIFTSIVEAKRALDLILTSIVQFFSSSPSSGTQSRVEKYAHHHARLQQWESAFHPLLIRAKAISSTPTATTKDTNLDSNLAPVVLSTYHRAAIIALAGAVNHNEMIYDCFRKDFSYIISSCRFILNSILPSPYGPYSADPGFTAAPRRRTPCFTFEVGLLPPLYVAATKCREPALRRQAISLLQRCPAQEGLWDPWGTSRIAEWMMEIEELGLEVAERDGEGGGGGEGERGGGTRRGEGQRKVFIPESSRVRLTGMRCELGLRRIWLECKGVVPETEDGLVKVWETVIQW